MVPLTRVELRSIRPFGMALRATLRDQLAPAEVAFRGSFAQGLIDRYSDVDLLAHVHRPLDRTLFETLLEGLRERFGPCSVRYDPEHRANRMAQGLRISFERFPIFWRLDLELSSDHDAAAKWPDPFPEWSVPASAFWNLVWAVKYAKRGKPQMADRYLLAACEKLERRPLRYCETSVQALLAALEEIGELEPALLGKLRAELW